eukprot:GCRY01003687.1.p1 GENE.GCRY01003687.1~~GCRY01003687.1.p1  ORF type:complete len:886 (+),score=125.92 GCRY01003687.1:1226-3883(+)
MKSFLGYWFFILLLVFVCYYSSPVFVPSINFENGNDTFDTGSAYSTLKDFCELGPRVKGTIANDMDAVHFLLRELMLIQESTRHNSNTLLVDVQASSEDGHFYPLRNELIAFQNLTNIIVRVFNQEKGGEASRPALLLSGHYDSVLESPGASDDASSQVIMLQVIKMLVNSEHPLVHDVIFNFLDSEETSMLGSLAFMRTHPWAGAVSAFLNLESVGAGGRQMVFQSVPNSSWLLKAFGRNALYPAASVVAEDFYRSGVIPSGTDFKIYSAQTYGQIPGLDLAFFDNPWVYHTYLDRIENISPAELGLAGHNVAGFVNAVARDDADAVQQLAAVYNKCHSIDSTKGCIAASNIIDGVSFQLTSVGDAYFDFFGLFLIVLPYSALPSPSLVAAVFIVLFFFYMKYQESYDLRVFVAPLMTTAFFLVVFVSVCGVSALVGMRSWFGFPGRAGSYPLTALLFHSIFVFMLETTILLRCAHGFLNSKFVKSIASSLSPNQVVCFFVGSSEAILYGCAYCLLYNLRVGSTYLPLVVVLGIGGAFILIVLGSAALKPSTFSPTLEVALFSFGPLWGSLHLFTLIICVDQMLSATAFRSAVLDADLITAILGGVVGGLFSFAVLPLSYFLVPKANGLNLNRWLQVSIYVAVVCMLLGVLPQYTPATPERVGFTHTLTARAGAHTNTSQHLKVDFQAKWHSLALLSAIDNEVSVSKLSAAQPWELVRPSPASYMQPLGAEVSHPLIDLLNTAPLLIQQQNSTSVTLMIRMAHPTVAYRLDVQPPSGLNLTRWNIGSYEGHPVPAKGTSNSYRIWHPLSLHSSQTFMLTLSFEHSFEHSVPFGEIEFQLTHYFTEVGGSDSVWSKIRSSFPRTVVPTGMYTHEFVLLGRFEDLF